MNIEFKTYDGGGNWVNARESKPDLLDDGTLVLYNAEWRTNGGRAVIDSRIVYSDNNLTSVWVTYYYSGKYRGGSQYYWHFKDGKRVTWKGLDDSERMLILDNIEHLPSFAKVPGKLVRDYLKPNELRKLEIDEQGTIYGYKYLFVDEFGDFHSPQRPECIWHNRELESDQEPSEFNTSGIYAMKSRKSKVLYSYHGERRVMVRLALSGTVVEANEGLRAQHAQVVEIL